MIVVGVGLLSKWSLRNGPDYKLTTTLQHQECLIHSTDYQLSLELIITFYYWFFSLLMVLRLQQLWMPETRFQII